MQKSLLSLSGDSMHYNHNHLLSNPAAQPKKPGGEGTEGKHEIVSSYPVFLLNTSE